jgi:hypothetical protein
MRAPHASDATSESPSSFENLIQACGTGLEPMSIRGEVLHHSPAPQWPWVRPGPAVARAVWPVTCGPTAAKQWLNYWCGCVRHFASGGHERGPMWDWSSNLVWKPQGRFLPSEDQTYWHMCVGRQTVYRAGCCHCWRRGREATQRGAQLHNTMGFSPGVQPPWVDLGDARETKFAGDIQNTTHLLVAPGHLRGD